MGSGIGSHATGWQGEDFTGAKIVLLIGGRLLTLLRDNRSDIPFPNMWDVPGGGREGSESPTHCVLRETEEEVGLRLSEADLKWTRQFANSGGALPSWWFAACLPVQVAGNIRFGNEGQCWRLVDPETWLNDPKIIDHFKPRVRSGLTALAATNC